MTEIIQNTNAFVFGAQFCSYNRGVVMAVGGSEAKFFYLDGLREVMEVSYDA